eukprot:gnl/MRDRNA2_/MRDRNA2_112201_c0_seq1.p1 gnl/MRDRNA2_/MRDRNA2_112201_c0~~gnl/MRDRNA2_/MRDRNA2_112201_c0_seq1.p1  ORF type:complete len:185 (-),score=20.35 gnl/MRDRNA2_/MRDRNA2_112201_c0_seq1:47-601(-)
MNLRGMFQDVPDPEQLLVVRWNAEPFAQGSYSFTARGTTDEIRDAFHYPHPSEANPRVHFAGEHTERGNQCVTSAYFSALRVGNCLLQQVFGEKPAPDEKFPSSSLLADQCPWSTDTAKSPKVKYVLPPRARPKAEERPKVTGHHVVVYPWKWRAAICALLGLVSVVALFVSKLGLFSQKASGN